MIPAFIGILMVALSFSLLGPNGAGKTTTISMLSTLYTPTSGDATNHAPVTDSFVKRIKNDHQTPEARFVFDLLTKTEYHDFIRMSGNGASIHVAVSADGERFEQLFLDTLNAPE